MNVRDLMPGLCLGLEMRARGREPSLQEAA